MARNNSFIRLQGTIDNVTFYSKNGVNFVKSKTTLDKTRIMNDRNFKRTRENMREFGGAAKASKSFRTAFAGSTQKFADALISSRMTGIMRSIVNFGDGNRGDRDILVTDHATMLVGIDFNREDRFSSRFYEVETLPAISADRNSVTWDVPVFNPDERLNAPEGATHFKMVLAAGYVSNFSYNYVDDSYEPIETQYDGKSGNMYSAAYLLNTAIPAVGALEVILDVGAVIPSDVLMPVALGIAFYQEVNGQLYELATGNAMKVVVAG